MKFSKPHLYLLCVLIMTSCLNIDIKSNETQDKTAFLKTLNTHLDAVVNRDIETLKTTLHPNGKMQLILPKEAMRTTVEEFVKYHDDWFKLDYEWSFKTKMLNYKVGSKLGMAVVEVLYEEPLRNGKPYYNKMLVSYDLEKTNGSWYFVKDHASSVEKSTDKKQ